MAVDVLSPDARKKVDELFLYWLSEPSTQELLRHELAKVCGLQQQRTELLSPTLNLRPRSPTARSITSPPPSPSLSPSNRSPKTPRASSHQQPIGKQPEAKVLTNGVVEEPDGPDQPVISTEIAVTKTAAESSSLSAEKPTSTHFKIPTIVLPVETIPQFYFPNGKLEKGKEREIEKVMVTVGKIFEQYSRQEVPRKDFHHVVKALKLPLYWKAPLFKMVAGRNKKFATLSSFKKTWLKMIQTCHDDASRFVHILSYSHSNRNYLIPEDFEVIVQDIVDTHPGLEFLRAAPEFHARYVETVIGRIFYSVDKSWKGRINISDLRNSTLLQDISQLEQEEDINKFTDFFSYEHFYVIYCKFWELDTDHDLLIDAQDLIRHSDHALTSRIVERLLSGVVTRNRATPPGKMSYKDFVWFLISEEDKNTPRSIEYWFRVLDKDGDGVLSLYELEYFYEEVLTRLDEMNIESLSVENTVCQVLDMINPQQHGVITLRDLKNSQLTSMFFNTFINIEKYLDYEQRDPVALSRDETDSEQPSDWEKYASEQYEILVAEEQYENDDLMEDEDMLDSDTELEDRATLGRV